MKTREFKVVDNRMLLRCPNCGMKRMVSVPPNLRRKNIRCHNCQEIVKCVLNRRGSLREVQSGKVILVTADGQETEIFLHDISEGGVGFELPSGALRARQLSAGAKVRFKCNWSSQVLGNGFYEIRSVKGQRVGAKKLK